MIKAFVFGKFFPFHNGHEAMINFALTKCDFLSVLVCSDQDEPIDGELRKKWIEDTFRGNKKLEVNLLKYNNTILPNTSHASINVSGIWAAEFSKLYPGYNFVITSEPYGEMVAGCMGIQHIPFDAGRQKIRISASAIRNDLVSNWKYLPAAVKPFFAIKIVLLGTESTGKTTLAGQLASYFNCTLVSEAGRELIEDSNDFTYDDLQLVAKAHAEKIGTAIRKDHILTVIDTDIHITQSYARFVFGKHLPVDENVYNTNKADLYFYLNNDVPYIQDGTRLSKHDRDLLDVSHRQILAGHGVDFVEITGDWQSRFDQCVAKISELIEGKRVI